MVNIAVTVPSSMPVVEIRNYIPESLQAAIIAGTSLADVSPYLNQAHADAGFGGTVIYPNGFFSAKQVVYYDGQSIIGGGGDSTTVNQIYDLSQSLYIPYNWLNNVTGKTLGGQWMNFGIQRLNPSGGHAIINCSYRGRFDHCVLLGGGIYTTNTSKGGSTMSSNLPGNHFIDNRIISAPLGALYSDIDAGTDGDRSTDTYVLNNIFQFCGSQDSSIATIQTPSLSGWNIVGNKIENAPGPLVANTAGSHSFICIGNLVDYTCDTPLIGQTNYCFNLLLDANGRNVIQGNTFKATHLHDLTQDYTVLAIDQYNNAGTQGNLVSNNIFMLPLDGGLTGTVKCAQVKQTHLSTCLGVAHSNVYAGIASWGQRGNMEQVWCKDVIRPVFPGLVALAGGGRSGATQLSFGVNSVTTCATNGDSLVLPASNGSGRLVAMRNLGAANAAVFPGVGDQINALGTNNSQTVNSAAAATYYDIDSGQWISFP